MCCNYQRCMLWTACVCCSGCTGVAQLLDSRELQAAERAGHHLILVTGKLKVLPQLNFTPAMVVAVKTLHLAAIVRLTLSPVLHDAPFVGGLSFCFLDMPYLDFDLR